VQANYLDHSPDVIWDQEPDLLARIKEHPDLIDALTTPPIIEDFVCFILRSSSYIKFAIMPG